MSNTPDEKLREILGEDDWRYTEKPSKIQALITKARIDELHLSEQGTDTEVSGLTKAEYYSRRYKELKEKL